MLKNAGELRVGDVWTERPQGRSARSFRAIAISPGLAPTTIRVIGECVTTGRRRRMDFFLVNRVEVREALDEDRYAGHLTRCLTSSASLVGDISDRPQATLRSPQRRPADPKKAKRRGEL
jgi:hypothetical protein